MLKELHKLTDVAFTCTCVICILLHNCSHTEILIKSRRAEYVWLTLLIYHQGQGRFLDLITTKKLPKKDNSRRKNDTTKDLMEAKVQIKILQLSNHMT